MLVILSQSGLYTIIDSTENEKFQQLDSKYKAPAYAMLHRYAFDELKNEGKIKVMLDSSLPDSSAY